MGTNTHQRRLKDIEEQVANDPEIRHREAQERRRRQELDLWLRVFEAFPEEFHGQLVKLFEEHGTRLSTEHRTLGRLYYQAMHQEWDCSPLPAALAQVYLDDPKAEAWRKCKQCNLPLPMRGGFWVDLERAYRLQGWLLYFHACPKCGGQPVRSFDSKPDHPYRDQPERPTTRWLFLDDMPTQEEVERWQKEAGQGDKA